VVNEAYSLLQGWAEGSIKVADEILQEHFGIERPWSFPVVDINQIVRQTNSAECVEGPASGSSGGGNAAAASTGGDDMSAVLCFTADAMVEMADGTMKKISDVETGDVVSTGTGSGAGVVTSALVHPVHKEVPVVSIETDYGELVGTPDHPILKDGEWIEFSLLRGNKSLSLETRYIDVFYNLEVDGDDIEGSSHSYVVNGITASGLGDNEVLNMRFPRQKEFKEASSASIEKQ